MSAVTEFRQCLACGGETRLVGRKKDCCYVACRECDSMQMDPVPTVEQLTAIYADDYADGSHLPDDPAVIQKLHARQREFSLGLVQKYCARGPVLEVGPGHGHFMAALRGAGIRAIGLEASKQMATSLRDRGFEVHQGYIDDKPPTSERFQGVFMSNVFEHLATHERVLTSLASLLEPGGRIIMVQPTAYLGQLLARLYLALFPDRLIPDFGTWLATPYHTLFISPLGMKAMASRVGLDLIEVQPAPTENRTGIMELIGHALTAVNRIGMRLTWRWPLVPSTYFVLEKPAN
jgi:SAM-dependent methyltransferase